MTSADTLRALVDGAKPGELPALAGELARALGAVLARTATPAAPPAPAEAADTLLTVEQAAGRLGVTRTWLYRHAGTLPFTRKLGHRTLRFSERELERWQRTRPAV